MMLVADQLVTGRNTSRPPQPLSAAHWNKEELMRNSDPLVWELDAACSDDRQDRCCEKLWLCLNSQCCNGLVVALVFLEGAVIISQLLIDLDLIQEPSSRNCSYVQAAPTLQERASELVSLRIILAYVSLAILSLFALEIFLKFISGGNRFCTQFIEVLDGILVMSLLALDIIFFVRPPLSSIHKAFQLLVLFRLLRVSRIIRSVVESRNRTLTQMLTENQREKQVAENKAEVLILKVEDLEHEVAYLKEKLKKAEREFLTGAKKSAHRKLRDTFSLSSCCGSNLSSQLNIGALDSKKPLNVDTQTCITVCEFCNVPQAVDFLAARMSYLALKSALSSLQVQNTSGSIGKQICGLGVGVGGNRLLPPLNVNTPLVSPGLSSESGYSSCLSSARPHLSSISPYGSLGDSMPPSSSGYYSSGRRSSRGTVFLFPDTRRTDSLESAGTISVELNILDEVAEVSPVPVEAERETLDEGGNGDRGATATAGANASQQREQTESEELQTNQGTCKIPMTSL